MKKNEKAITAIGKVDFKKHRRTGWRFTPKNQMEMYDLDTNEALTTPVDHPTMSRKEIAAGRKLMEALQKDKTGELRDWIRQYLTASKK